MSQIWWSRDGAKLFALANGEGAPIILIHGGLANHQSCRRFAAPLELRYRLITPDLRGSGRSVFAGELSWDILADDIAALIRHLVATFDPASVAATTRFMASGAQPFATAADLAAIRVPVLVVPGVDPTHPAEVAALYARHLPAATLTETGDFAAAIADFMDRQG